MEVRLNTHGRNSLATKVFFSDESGFEVASVIVTGKTDAVLIDAQWTLSNAHRVIAEILETGKYLKTIYITHAHPDHYFGLGTIAEAFPEARVVALPSEARIINKQFFGKTEHWEKVIGVINVPRKTAKIEPLTGELLRTGRGAYRDHPRSDGGHEIQHSSLDSFHTDSGRQRCSFQPSTSFYVRAYCRRTTAMDTGY